MRLTFLISNYKLIELEVDVDRKKTSIIYVDDDDLSVDAILSTSDMTYIGLERRLQFLMDDSRPLPELIESIRLYDINTPIQYNLHIKVDDVD